MECFNFTFSLEGNVSVHSFNRIRKQFVIGPITFLNKYTIHTMDKWVQLYPKYLRRSAQSMHSLQTLLASVDKIYELTSTAKSFELHCFLWNEIHANAESTESRYHMRKIKVCRHCMVYTVSSYTKEIHLLQQKFHITQLIQNYGTKWKFHTECVHNGVRRQITAYKPKGEWRLRRPKQTRNRTVTSCQRCQYLCKTTMPIFV